MTESQISANANFENIVSQQNLLVSLSILYISQPPAIADIQIQDT